MNPNRQPREFVSLIDVSIGGDISAWEGQATVRFKFSPGVTSAPPEITDVRCMLIDGGRPDRAQAELIEEEILQNEALMQHLMDDVK